MDADGAETLGMGEATGCCKLHPGHLQRENTARRGTRATLTTDAVCGLRLLGS